MFNLIYLSSDSAKNKLASEVINRLLDGCCWMNLHFIKPQECVIEIRVREGYGARWSADGTKVMNLKTIKLIICLCI